jgi:putative endopeptidase
VLVDELEQKAGCAGVEKKVADFFASAMDVAAIDAAGTAPLDPIFAACSAEAIAADVTQVCAILKSQFDVTVPFSFYESPDKKRSEWSIGQVGQSGLGLPDRDYYFDEDKAEKRELYVAHIAKMFVLLGDEEAAAQEAAASVMAFETALAQGHWTKTDLRDPERTYNKMAVADLQASCDAAEGGGGAIQWERFFEVLGKPVDALGEINVSTVDAVVQASALLKTTAPETLALYFKWKAVHGFASFHLPTPFQEEHFAFYSKVSCPQPTSHPPRWRF